MKKISQISFLTGAIILFCFATGYSQQTQSKRSYASIMTEVKQIQIARDKRLQQMKRPAAPSSVIPAGTQIQPVPGSTVTPTAAQNSSSLPATNQQPANRQINTQSIAPRVKKQ